MQIAVIPLENTSASSAPVPHAQAVLDDILVGAVEARIERGSRLGAARWRLPVMPSKCRLPASALSNTNVLG